MQIETGSQNLSRVAGTYSYLVQEYNPSPIPPVGAADAVFPRSRPSRIPEWNSDDFQQKLEEYRGMSHQERSQSVYAGRASISSERSGLLVDLLA